MPGIFTADDFQKKDSKELIKHLWDTGLFKENHEYSAELVKLVKETFFKPSSTNPSEIILRLQVLEDIHYTHYEKIRQSEDPEDIRKFKIIYENIILIIAQEHPDKLGYFLLNTIYYTEIFKRIEYYNFVLNNTTESIRIKLLTQPSDETFSKINLAWLMEHVFNKDQITFVDLKLYLPSIFALHREFHPEQAAAKQIQALFEKYPIVDILFSNHDDFDPQLLIMAIWMSNNRQRDIFSNEKFITYLKQCNLRDFFSKFNGFYHSLAITLRQQDILAVLYKALNNIDAEKSVPTLTLLQFAQEKGLDEFVSGYGIELIIRDNAGFNSLEEILQAVRITHNNQNLDKKYILLQAIKLRSIEVLSKCLNDAAFAHLDTLDTEFIKNVIDEFDELEDNTAKEALAEWFLPRLIELSDKPELLSSVNRIFKDIFEMHSGQQLISAYIDKLPLQMAYQFLDKLHSEGEMELIQICVDRLGITPSMGITQLTPYETEKTKVDEAELRINSTEEFSAWISDFYAKQEIATEPKTEANANNFHPQFKKLLDALTEWANAQGCKLPQMRKTDEDTEARHPFQIFFEQVWQSYQTESHIPMADQTSMAYWQNYDGKVKSTLEWILYYVNKKNSIPLEERKNIIKELMMQIIVCGPGAREAILKAKSDLEIDTILDHLGKYTEAVMKEAYRAVLTDAYRQTYGVLNPADLKYINAVAGNTHNIQWVHKLFKQSGLHFNMPFVINEEEDPLFNPTIMHAGFFQGGFDQAKFAQLLFAKYKKIFNLESVLNYCTDQVQLAIDSLHQQYLESGVTTPEFRSIEEYSRILFKRFKSLGLTEGDEVYKDIFIDEPITLDFRNIALAIASDYVPEQGSFSNDEVQVIYGKADATFDPTKKYIQFQVDGDNISCKFCISPPDEKEVVLVDNAEIREIIRQKDNTKLLEVLKTFISTVMPPPRINVPMIHMHVIQQLFKYDLIQNNDVPIYEIQSLTVHVDAKTHELLILPLGTALQVYVKYRDENGLPAIRVLDTTNPSGEDISIVRSLFNKLFISEIDQLVKKLLLNEDSTLISRLITDINVWSLVLYSQAIDPDNYAKIISILFPKETSLVNKDLITRLLYQSLIDYNDFAFELWCAAVLYASKYDKEFLQQLDQVTIFGFRRFDAQFIAARKILTSSQSTVPETVNLLCQLKSNYTLLDFQQRGFVIPNIKQAQDCYLELIKKTPLVSEIAKFIELLKRDSALEEMELSTLITYCIDNLNNAPNRYGTLESEEIITLFANFYFAIFDRLDHNSKVSCLANLQSKAEASFSKIIFTKLLIEYGKRDDVDMFENLLSHAFFTPRMMHETQSQAIFEKLIFAKSYKCIEALIKYDPTQTNLIRYLNFQLQTVMDEDALKFFMLNFKICRPFLNTMSNLIYFERAIALAGNDRIKNEIKQELEEYFASLREDDIKKYISTREATPIPYAIKYWMNDKYFPLYRLVYKNLTSSGQIALLTETLKAGNFRIFFNLIREFKDPIRFDFNDFVKILKNTSPEIIKRADTQVYIQAAFAHYSKHQKILEVQADAYLQFMSSLGIKTPLRDIKIPRKAGANLPLNLIARLSDENANNMELHTEIVNSPHPVDIIIKIVQDNQFELLSKLFSEYSKNIDFYAAFNSLNDDDLVAKLPQILEIIFMKTSVGFDYNAVLFMKSLQKRPAFEKISPILMAEVAALRLKTLGPQRDLTYQIDIEQAWSAYKAIATSDAEQGLIKAIDEFCERKDSGFEFLTFAARSGSKNLLTGCFNYIVQNIFVYKTDLRFLNFCKADPKDVTAADLAIFMNAIFAMFKEGKVDQVNSRVAQFFTNLLTMGLEAPRLTDALIPLMLDSDKNPISHDQIVKFLKELPEPLHTVVNTKIESTPELKHKF